ncbi:MAG: PIN domain-containing protein [Syntrophobacteraceae bacterium]
MILVDTSVWSLAFRRRRSELNEPDAVRLFRDLIEVDEEIALPGIVLQEILSGVREKAQFERLEEALAGFPVILATQKTHIEAARIANACRSKGIAVSAVDCLIAAMAIEHDAQLFTTDRDFVHMAEHCPLRLLENK